MKRKIKTLFLKDGKQIFYPTDDECKRLWNDVERIDIEESYSIEEWKQKYVLIRAYDDRWYCSKCNVYHNKAHVCVRLGGPYTKPTDPNVIT